MARILVRNQKAAAAAAAKSLQSCPTLCDPIDGSPPDSAVPGILQARTLEWVAISFSNAKKWKVKVTSLSHVRLLKTPWTAAHQAPPSMGFSMQEYWSGVPRNYIISDLYERYFSGCLRLVLSPRKEMGECPLSSKRSTLQWAVLQTHLAISFPFKLFLKLSDFFLKFLD